MTALPEVPRYEPLLTDKGYVKAYRAPDGKYVLYADHLTAMQAQRDTALREALAAVEALEHWTAYDQHGDPHACFASDPTAAIQRLIDGGGQG